MCAVPDENHKDETSGTSSPPGSADSVARTESKRFFSQGLWAAGAVFLALFVWAFWHTLAELWRSWQAGGDYSAGQLVPLAVVYMLIARRSSLCDLRLTFGFAGLGVFGLGVIVEAFGSYYLYASLSRVGVVLCVNGIAIVFYGWEGYKRLWFPLVYLFLMLPLPGRLHDAVMFPLQGVGARISAGILEIIGIPVQRFGRVLEVGGHQIAVAEACSGLRMALAFLIVAGLLAYLVNRPFWQKAVVLASSVPIALACNVARIVLSAFLYNIGAESLAQGMFHSAAGLLMMPMAIVLIFMELWLLAKLERESPGVAETGSGSATVSAG